MHVILFWVYLFRLIFHIQPARPKAPLYLVRQTPPK